MIAVYFNFVQLSKPVLKYKSLKNCQSIVESTDVLYFLWLKNPLLYLNSQSFFITNIVQPSIIVIKSNMFLNLCFNLVKYSNLSILGMIFFNYQSYNWKSIKILQFFFILNYYIYNKNLVFSSSLAKDSYFSYSQLSLLTDTRFL